MWSDGKKDEPVDSDKSYIWFENVGWREPSHPNSNPLHQAPHEKKPTPKLKDCAQFFVSYFKSRDLLNKQIKPETSI